MQSIAIELIPDTMEGGYTARVPDVPAYGEGATEEEAIADLKEAFTAYIETYGIEDALSRINASSELSRVESSLGEFSLSV